MGVVVLAFWPSHHDSQDFSFLEKGKQTWTLHFLRVPRPSQELA